MLSSLHKYLPATVLFLIICTTGCQKDDSGDNNGPDANTQTLSGTISTETVWKNTVSDPAKPDYIVSKDLSIESKLIVEPGVVVLFKAGTALIIEEKGTLIAKGSATQKIVFTGEEKITGFWRGILFFSNDVRNIMDYTEVSYGGGSPVDEIWLNTKANVALATSGPGFGKVSFTNSLSANSAGAGLYVTEGAELNTFAANSFSSNATKPVILPASEVKKLDVASKYKGSNGKDVIEIIESSLDDATESTWLAPTDGTHYFVSGDLEIESGLRIQEGVTFEFGSSTALIVMDDGGYLIAKGTSAKKIIFTGENQTQPSWRGILFYSGDVRNEMDYTEVTYAGSSAVNNIWLDEKANIGLTYRSAVNAKLKLSNSKVTNGGGWGIVVQKYGDAGTSLTSSNNVLTPNSSGTIKQ